MEFKKLGDLSVSRIAYGCWAMGGHGWGTVNDEDSIKAVHQALELGINFFDTADVYGFGHSEEILSKALGHKKHEVVIATKVGVSWDEAGSIGRNGNAKYIVNALEGSLNRLKIDCITLYQIHWPDPKTPIEETLNALKKCQEQGKIRYIGCSNFSSLAIEEAMLHSHITSLQLPYSLIERKIEADQLKTCIKNAIGVLTYGSLAKGLFSGKFNRDSLFKPDDNRSKDAHFKGEQYEKNLHLVELLKQIGTKYNKTSAQVALRWVLDTAGITSIITGIKTAKQIEENSAALGWSLTKEDYHFLSSVAS
jgi:aryl-alcohol dehydrogenase-like predicted oxidoreductase